MIDEGKNPQVTVVIITYNRREMLCIALESLLHQETNGRFKYEIIVVDDGSTDGTKGLVEDIIEKTNWVPIKYVQNNYNGGIPAARNKGVVEARGEWIAFFDDDQWGERQWLSELFDIAERKCADCVGGSMMLDFPKSKRGNLSPFCRSMIGERLLSGASGPYPPDIFPCTNNVIIRKTLFEKIGYFDTRFRRGSDAEFFGRARILGARIWFAPRAVGHAIVPEHRLTKDYFKRRLISEGIIAARLRYILYGRVRWILALIRRVFRAGVRDIWLIYSARLIHDEASELDRRCRLWETWGFLKESLNIILYDLSKQKDIIPD